jgi:hypothetical protein
MASERVTDDATTRAVAALSNARYALEVLKLSVRPELAVTLAAALVPYVSQDELAAAPDVIEAGA